MLRNAARWLIGASCWLPGCHGGSHAEVGGGSTPSEADRRAGQLEFESVRDGFGQLRTLAGIGRVGDDTNDWRPEYEGGPATECELSTPHNAVGDDAGNTYIADKEAHAVRRVDPDGIITTIAGMNVRGDDGDTPGPGTERHLDWPNGVWVTRDGTLYILEIGNRKVRKLDRAGQLSTLFAVEDVGQGRGLWVSENESLAYVSAGTRVLSWTPREGVRELASGFRELGNLYVTEDGTLYVTDRGTHRVFKVASDASAEVLAGNGRAEAFVDGSPALEASLEQVRGIWQHAAGGFVLGMHAGNRVVYLDSKGFVHLLIDGGHDAHAGDGEPLSSPGQKVSEVRNVTINPQGGLLITEHDFGFVRLATRAGD